MGFADVWNKTLVYFGIAEEEDWDEDSYVGSLPVVASESSTTGPTPSRWPTTSPR
jgi:hypothetical protein